MNNREPQHQWLALLSSDGFSFRQMICLQYPSEHTSKRLNFCETGTKPRHWTSVLMKSFACRFVNPSGLVRGNKENNIQNLRRTVTYTETQHQQRLAGESADLGFICWTKDCVSSSGWIGQVHRARHIPQRTWSWNKQRGNRGRGLLFYSSSPSLFIPSPWVLMNGDRQHPCSCQDETAVKSWLLSLSA